ncbi:MAG: extracellular solute-binding protein [Deltaproteobacteria bacterium]|nr:extracellular solute-binding protein [Deltaproteobacteria bacterium]
MKLKVRAIGVVSLIILLYPLETAAAEIALYRELVKKAQSEGQVEFWAPSDEKSVAEILGFFSKRFGIKTKYMRWVDTGVQQRTLIELQSGRAIGADVLAPNREAQQQFLDAGVFQQPPFDYLKVWPDIDKRQYDPSGWAINLTGNSRAIAYNPKLVPPDLVPKTWDDCTRPEFKGKVVLDPRHKLLALHWHKREWFLGWVKKMVANDVKLIRGQTETMQLLAAGAYSLYCSVQPYSAQDLIDKGTENLKVVVPGELLMEAAWAAFIRKGSPRSHAAQLLVGWFASEEGQRLLDKVEYKGFPWVKGTFNAKLAAGNKVLFCDPECAAKAGEMSAEYIRALGLPVTK